MENRYRRARGRRLQEKIRRTAERLGHEVRILDVGGRAGYWDSVELDGIGQIVILNVAQNDSADPSGKGVFSFQMGDARDLSWIADQSFHLVHSNSVIEHVGPWQDMQRMAAECVRVGIEGWVQTPSWLFPIEPHFKIPALHWFASPVRRAILRSSPKYGVRSLGDRRAHVDRINLLTHDELKSLFPQATIWVERFALLSKSYVAIW